MSHADQTIPFPSFFDQGAIIGQVGQWVELFWGDISYSNREDVSSVSTLYSNDFFLGNPTPWRTYSHHQKLSWSEWQSQLSAMYAEYPPKGLQINWKSPARDSFNKNFSEIINSIEQGVLLKAVPVVSEKASKNHFEFINLFRTSPENTYAYGFWENDKGVFGYTPEVLFETNPHGLSSMALAGTCSKVDYQNHPDKFMNDYKEKREHAFVVDDLRAKLSKYGDVKIGSTECLELDHLVHLHTKINIKTKESPSFVSLLETLHPTSALGVFPSSELESLKSWRAPESLLGAPFGLRRSHSDSICLVGIRNIQWDDDHIYIGSGCGIVKESDAEKEWQELSLKRSSVRKMLGL